MSAKKEATFVKIVPTSNGSPPGKLADAEMIFGVDAGPLNGLKLVGFSVWERRGQGDRNVTFPARTFTVNGDKRTFALLRPFKDLTAQETVKALILDAYSRIESSGQTESEGDGDAVPD